MQLKKRHIRSTPTFDGKRTDRGNPIGILRQPSDFNQRANMRQANRNAFGDTFERVNR